MGHNNLLHQSDPALDFAIITRIIVYIDHVAAVQFHIPADDLGIEFRVGRVVSIDGDIAIRGKDGPIHIQVAAAVDGATGMSVFVAIQDDQIAVVFRPGLGGIQVDGTVDAQAEVMPGGDVDRDATCTIQAVEGCTAPVNVVVHTIDAGSKHNVLVIADQPGLWEIRVISGVDPPVTVGKVGWQSSRLTAFSRSFWHIYFFRDPDLLCGSALGYRRAAGLVDGASCRRNADSPAHGENDAAACL